MSRHGPRTVTLSLAQVEALRLAARRSLYLQVEERPNPTALRAALRRLEFTRREPEELVTGPWGPRSRRASDE